jgi:hypothetical protein
MCRASGQRVCSDKASSVAIAGACLRVSHALSRYATLVAA